MAGAKYWRLIGVIDKGPGKCEPPFHPHLEFFNFDIAFLMQLDKLKQLV
ncbi:MAG: hypothetical protein Q8S57_07690 [Methanoregula sp.]|nr:hypothetical protein [Methanoregula sp.]